MKRLKIRESQGIETVETLEAACPFFVADTQVAYYDPHRQALVKLAPKSDPSIGNWPHSLLGEGKYILITRYLPGGRPKYLDPPENFRLALRNLLTGEVTALPKTLPYNPQYNYAFTTDMRYCFYRKIWADDPNHTIFNPPTTPGSFHGETYLALRNDPGLYTGLYRCDLNTGETEEILKLQGMSFAYTPAVTVNPQGTIAIIDVSLVKHDPPIVASVEVDLTERNIGRLLEKYSLTSSTSWNADGTKCAMIEPKECGALRVLDFADNMVEGRDINKGLLAPGSGAQDGAMFIHGIANDGRVYASGEMGKTLIIQLIDIKTGEREELFRITSEDIKYATFAQNTKDFYLKPAD